MEQGRGTVLIAEDNENLASALAKFLTSRGFGAIIAADGARALQLYASTRVDLLVLDLRLPVMQGTDVLRKIRASAKGKDLPVVIMSGAYRGEKFVEGARKLGVEHCLEKPFQPSVFLDAVESALVARNRSGLDILLALYRRGGAGTVRAEGAAPVCFHGGEPVSFVTRGRNEFPRFLEAKGKLSSADAAAFIDSGCDRLFLTRSGMLTLDELQAESRLFLAGEVRKIVEAPSAELSPAEAVELPAVYLPLPQFMYDSATASPLRSEALLSPDRYPARTSEFYRNANLISMHEEDIDLLALVDGTRPLGEILAGTPDPERGKRFFLFLLALEMVRLEEAPAGEDPPPPTLKHLFNRPLREEAALMEASFDFADLVDEVSASVAQAVSSETMAVPLSSAEIDFEQTVLRDHAFLKGKDYYQIFGLSQHTFSFDKLKEAYFSRTRPYSPEKFMELSGTTSALAEEVLSVCSSAYNTLSNVVSKERYDEILNADKVGLDGKQDERLQASIQLQSGKVFLEMGEFDNAEKALQDAYTLSPDHAAICAYLGWAIYCNPSNRNSLAAKEKAKSLLSRSLQMQRNATAYTFRGWVLLDEGRDGLAEGEFQKALKLDPQNMHARKGMRQVGDKRESERKGIFRKFFG